jgi:hypothetical protein
MNYKAIYKRLVRRAKICRPLSSLRYELHHIKPRCLGGSDAKRNLVYLTPEEHYVAHQLLVKINPGNKSLLWAAFAMTGTGNGRGNGRQGNKLYGWLKRQFIEGQAGKPRWDDETKARIGAHSKARNQGENHPMFGRKQTPSARQKIGKKNREHNARKRAEGNLTRAPFSPEHCASISFRRRKFYEEGGAVNYKGCKHSKEIRASMHEAHERRREFFEANGFSFKRGSIDPAHQLLWKKYWKAIKQRRKAASMAPELREAA